jgi:aspartyl-tRNA(Asn)/glutamyl-tRNA(Gln) amidotransferase subunit A
MRKVDRVCQHMGQLEACAKRICQGMAACRVDRAKAESAEVGRHHHSGARFGIRAIGHGACKEPPDKGDTQTTTPEFGWKAVTDNPKNGVTRNPRDTTKTPGGSSGGAAVAAATGAGVLHLGSDGGGSIRIPASFTGIMGLKPTFGRVATSPAISFGTIAHIGPMTRAVDNAARMLDVMEGRDLRDWTQPAQSFAPVNGKPVSWKGKHVGYWRSPCVVKADPQVSAAVEAVRSDLGQAGAIVSEVQLPDRDALLGVFCRHWYVGTATRLALIDPARHVHLDPGFLDAARKGQAYTAVEHMRAELDRAQYAAKMDSLLDQFDLLVSPTVATLPFEAGRNVPEDSGYGTWIEWASFTFPINLSQQPACSVPCGLSAEGLPIGLKIIGPRGADSAVLGAARAYEDIMPQHFLLGRKGTNWPQVHARS